MNIINFILNIWLVGVGLMILFFACDSIINKWPDARFSKWWRTHIVGILDKNDKRF